MVRGRVQKFAQVNDRPTIAVDFPTVDLGPPIVPVADLVIAILVLSWGVADQGPVQPLWDAALDFQGIAPDLGRCPEIPPRAAGLDVRDAGRRRHVEQAVGHFHLGLGDAGVGHTVQW